MILYRPVGLKELELIAASGFREFPPRLAWQPIFYPVLTRDYARQIVTQWNSKEGQAGFCGFVTEFEVDDTFAGRYPVRQLGGGPVYRELWVPAEELAEFNAHIRGPIRVVESVYGDGFTGERDPESGLPLGVVEAGRGGG
ncbi:MAG: ADP-ribosylation/crystallin J1 [Isosphaera sp.]|nr:ADP-ribosylation/crystallin J1 [Isosphaera sp.]